MICDVKYTVNVLLVVWVTQILQVNSTAAVKCVAEKVFLLYRSYVLKVPELAGFWLLSILLQFPLILFQLFNETILIQPLERGVHMVLALMILIQVGIQLEVPLIILACACWGLHYFTCIFSP